MMQLQLTTTIGGNSLRAPKRRKRTGTETKEANARTRAKPAFEPIGGMYQGILPSGEVISVPLSRRPGHLFELRGDAGQPFELSNVRLILHTVDLGWGGMSVYIPEGWTWMRARRRASRFRGNGRRYPRSIKRVLYLP